MKYKGYEIEAFDHVSCDINKGVKIRVNGVKFPKEQGEHYVTTNERKAIDWAIAEYEGKYLSRGGLVYESKAHYDAWQYLEDEYESGFDVRLSNHDLVEVFDLTPKQARVLLAEFIDSLA